jgi:hypothetical protein
MCECGCAEWNPEARLKGADGEWYGLQVDIGCNDCWRGAGVMIQRLSLMPFGPEELAALPDLTPTEDVPNRTIPVVDEEALKRWVALVQEDEDCVSGDFSWASWARETARRLRPDWLVSLQPPGS